MIHLTTFVNDCLIHSLYSMDFVNTPEMSEFLKGGDKWGMFM
jgi:hypothetical protein